MPVNYDDFGQIIDGAKKFNYSNFTYNSDSNFETVSKKVLWPEPPIGQKDLFVEFIIHKFWRCIRSTLKSDNPIIIDEYISQVLALKTLMENARSEEEVLGIIRRLDYTRDEQGNLIFNKKLILTKRIKFWELTRSQMEIEGFGLSKEEKELKEAKSIIKSFIINDSFILQDNSLQFKSNGKLYTYPLTPNLNKSDLVIGKLIIIQDGNVVAINQSLEEYEILLQDFISEQKKKKSNQRKRNRIKTPYLKEVHHEGSDYRSGFDILPDSLKDRFHFYGGQFGNWLPQKERVEVINLAYDAFSDLAIALNIKDSDISLNSKLGLAFGARGSGKGSAHYEPDHHVINLTRIKGAGSLAHEWLHFLDHSLSEKLNKNNQLLSEQDDISLESLKTIVDYLKNIATNYRLDSLSFDTYENRKKAYWSLPSEMLARAFNIYIIDKLESLNIINDYLCYDFNLSIDLGNKHKAFANPRGTDRKKLNILFDDFFEELKSIDFLHDRDDNIETKSEERIYHFKSESNFFNYFYSF